MEQIPDTNSDKRQIINAIFFPCLISVFMVLSFVFEKGMNLDFHTAGIYPRRLENIWGIFTLIFVHADLTHLTNNVISFVILGSLLYFFYQEIATKVLIISYIISGLILWGIGRENWHIGASGLIYSLAFFLFFSGILRKHIPLIAISLTVAFIYGSMVWHIFPWQAQDPISWEGHLSGCIVGSVLSLIYRKDEPQKPDEKWDENDDSIDYMTENDANNLNSKE
jgi:membrane associated rhomboid family serine protease